MANETDNSVGRANTLYEAMKGFGTDEAKLINVVAGLSDEDIAPLTSAYMDRYGHLETAIKAETSGCFQDALVALLTPMLKYDAIQCRKALKGLITNEQVLIEVLCTRSLEERKLLSENVYFLTNIAYFEKDVETCGEDFKDILLRRFTATEEKGDIDSDVEELYKAGQSKLGTDEAAFIKILCHRSSEYLAELNTAYASKYGDSLATVIDSEFSGVVKRALTAIVTPPAEYYTELLHKAMKGLGTDDATLIRIIASQRFRCLKEIAALYVNRYGVSLKSAVADELSGDYKKLILAIIEYIVEGQVPVVV